MNENGNTNINNGVVSSNNTSVNQVPVTPAMPQTLNNSTPVQPQNDSGSMPVNQTQVTSPASQMETNTIVNQTPVAQTTTETQSLQESSPFFTPVSVKPETQVSPELPPITPASPAPQPVTQETNGTEVVSVQPQSETATNDVEVIETVQKGKASNIVLIIFLVLLIAFVLNIDTIIKMYDQYKETGTITNNQNEKNINNLTDGYILIDDSTSSIKVKDIKFYNFRKAQGKGITFSYEVLSNYSDAKALEIYVELYNSEKEIIYKELFNPNQKLEKDTVRTYVMSVENDIFDPAFYALVKTYTDKEKSESSSLTCTYNNKNYSYKYVFNFLNNGLDTYEVEKTSMVDEDEKLKSEYEELKDSNNAVLEGNTLKYKVDLNVENDNIVTLFDKDTTIKVIKDKQTQKEWKCE